MFYQSHQRGAVPDVLDVVQFRSQQLNLPGVQEIFFLEAQISGIAEIFTLIMICRGENAGCRQSEHENEADHENRKFGDYDSADIHLRCIGTLFSDIPDSEPQHNYGQYQNALMLNISATISVSMPSGWNASAAPATCAEFRIPVPAQAPNCT